MMKARYISGFPARHRRPRFFFRLVYKLGILLIRWVFKHHDGEKQWVLLRGAK